MNEPVFILGGYQTDFAKVWSRQGLDISDMTREATQGVLEACGVCPPCGTKARVRPRRWRC